MARQKRQRKLRGGIVGALIGLASLAIPSLIDAFGSSGPSREEQEAAIREDYYARLAEYDRQKAEREEAERQRILAERNRQQMIENSRISQSMRKEDERALQTISSQAAARQRSQRAAEEQQRRMAQLASASASQQSQLRTQQAQLEAQRRAAESQQSALSRRSTIATGELDVTRRAMEEQMRRDLQQRQKSMTVQQQLMENQIRQQMASLTAAQQIQEQPQRRRVVPVAATNIALSRVGRGVDAEALSILMNQYGLSLRDAKRVYKSLV